MAACEYNRAGFPCGRPGTATVNSRWFCNEHAHVRSMEDGISAIKVLLREIIDGGPIIPRDLMDRIKMYEKLMVALDQDIGS